MVGNSDLLDLYTSLRRSVAVEANGVLKEIGLGSRQFIILWSLNSSQQMTVGDLVIAAMTDAATVSRSLVQLIRQGYVEKTQCQKDGRVWYVKLTPKGRKLAPEMERLYLHLAKRCFSVLQAKEREELAKLLGKVVSGLTVSSQDESVSQEIEV